MDVAALAGKVQTSQLLTESEKQYWLQNLQRMNPEQLTKLETILSEALKLAWGPEMQHYLAIASKATKAFAQPSPTPAI